MDFSSCGDTGRVRRRLDGREGVCRPAFDQNEIRESVVRIEVETEQGTRAGTGFIINDKRTIATNNHVIEGAKSIYVTFLAAGKPTAVPARLITTDPVKDLAIIEATSDLFGEPVVLANYDTQPPAKVTAIGYPGAADFVAGGVPATSSSTRPTPLGRWPASCRTARCWAAPAHPAHGRRKPRQQRRSAVR